MDDHDAVNNDDDPQSLPPTHSPPDPPGSTAVTVAASPDPQILTLALPIQAPAASNGREEWWSEGATSSLIEAWGERYLELSRGNLKQKQWEEVADAVSARDDYTKPPKTDVQCKSRIDTLKKKYKSEKSKIASGQSHSSAWPFFHRLDILIGPNFLKPPAPKPTGTPFPLQALPQKTRSPQTTVNSNVVKKRSRSLSAESEEEEKELSHGLRELTRAIARFGEVYERVERAKTLQAVEIEKQRMGFARDLQLQRMQLFVNTQMELSQPKGRSTSRPPRKMSSGGGDDQRHHCRSADNRIDNENK